MDDMWTRVGEQLMARVSGPMHFRLYLQPGMAAVLAIIAGLKDAKAGATQEPPCSRTPVLQGNRAKLSRGDETCQKIVIPCG